MLLLTHRLRVPIMLKTLMVAKNLMATLAGAAILLPATLYAAEQPFVTWVDAFKQEARTKGVSQSLLDEAFRNLTPNDRVIELDRRQPEGTMTFSQYRQRIVNDQRIREGRKRLAQHRTALERVSKQYGVQPRFIVALWGIETNYGSNTGGFDIIEALATLAYDGRRSDFFRRELYNALTIVQEGHIKLDDMRGSWAGAMGQCQFMPSSFLAYAQDGDGDGKKDIWNNLDDVFASIANYLAKSGWNDQQTWGRAIRVPAGFDRSQADLKITRSLEEWSALGVRNADGGPLPRVAGINASVVFPDKEGDEAYLAYDNYRVVMRWNRSLYFATSVGLLSDALAGH